MVGPREVFVVHPFSPETTGVGGVDACIRDMVRFAPPDVQFSFLGVVPDPRAPLGQWRGAAVAGRDVRALAVAHLDPGDPARRRPHSLRLALGLLRFRPRLPSGQGAVLLSHRVDVGAIATTLYPRVAHFQLVHGEGGEGLASTSDSIWRSAAIGYRALERYAVARSERVAVFSGAGAARLSRFRPGGNDVFAVKAWFDPDIFHPGATDRTASARRALSVLWVGRLERPKDPDLAIRTFAEIVASGVDAELSVIGDGSRRHDLEVLARELGVETRVTLLGQRDPGDVARAMRNADVLLVTSHFEGAPRVIVESMACGLPVATVPEADPEGLVVSPVGATADDRSPAALSAAVREAARTREPLLVARAVEDRSADRVVTKLLDDLYIARA